MTRRIIIPKNNIPASLTFLTTTLDKKPNNSKTLEETSDDDDDENYDDDDSDSFITAYSGSPLKKITQQGISQIIFFPFYLFILKKKEW